MRINLDVLIEREKAKGRHITQMTLAEELSVAQGTISRWIGNRVTMADLTILDKLCDYFGVEPGDILVRK